MVNSSTVLADTIFFVKNFLNSNITDPKAASRPANQRFVMTSYPTRPVTYPIVTIKDLSLNSGQALGLQSEAYFMELNLEVRVWADNVVDRDTIAQEIFQEMKDNQIGPTGTSQANDLHDLQLVSTVNIDDPSGPKTKVMNFRYKFVAT